MEPENQRPPTVSEAELPGWAQATLLPLYQKEQKARDGYSRYVNPDVDAGCLLYLIWPVGVGLLAWGLYALRSDELVWWRWAAGATLAAVGIVAILFRYRQTAGLPLGTLLTPAGIFVVVREGVRLVAREHIHAITFDGGRLEVVYGPEQRRWCLYSAEPGSKGERYLTTRHQELVHWHQTGVGPSQSHPTVQAHREPDTRKFLGGFAAATIGLVGFLWLTGVMPATSDSGRTVRGFVRHVGSGQLDEAYAMLSASARKRIPRAAFESRLSPALRGSTGFSVNGVSGSIGTIAGAESCVDGWLQGESNAGYAFELKSEEGTDKIVEWRAGACRRRN